MSDYWTLFGPLAQPSIDLYAIDSVGNPDITNYIHNSKESSYDRWKFESLHASDNPIRSNSTKESVVNSSSLTELIAVGFAR